MGDGKTTGPLIGITVDNRDNRRDSGKYEQAIGYSRAVSAAGGLPVLLPHEPDRAGQYARRLDGILFTGGVDPDTECFGESLHPQARPMDPVRQDFELNLLEQLDARPELPVLGVCLGMQLMALHHGGKLDQHLPDQLASARAHQDDRRHPVKLMVPDSVLEPTAAPQETRLGRVVSWHRQAVSDPGAMRVVARAPDGVIEAIDMPATRRRFYLGVQWHPERGGDGPLNGGLIQRFVSACTGE